MLHATALRVVVAHYRRHFIGYMLAAALFVLGTVAGILAAGGVETGITNEMHALVGSWFADPTAGLPFGTYESIVVDAISTDVVGTPGLFWLLGLSIIGVPFMLAIVFSRGFALGFTAYVIATTGGSRWFLAMVTLIPHQVPMLLGTLLAAVAALQFATVAARTLLARPPASTVPRQFLASSGLVLVAAALVIVARLTEAYATPLLVRLALLYGGTVI